MGSGFELARQNGPDSRIVWLDGDSERIRLSTSDTGPKVEQALGRVEYEFWVDVAQANVRSLALALLKEKYAGNLKAVDQFQEFCQKNGIPANWSSWTS